MIAAIKLVLDYKNGMALTESSTDDANSMKFDSAIFKWFQVKLLYLPLLSNDFQTSRRTSNDKIEAVNFQKCKQKRKQITENRPCNDWFSISNI